MNSLVILVGVLLALFLVLSGWLAITRIKISQAKEAADNRIIQLEARLSEAEHSKTQLEKRQTQSKPASQKAGKRSDSEHATDLTDLRKEVAKFRDESQKLRSELRTKEAELKDAREGVEKKLYVLQEENKRLLEIAREQDKKIASRTSTEVEENRTLRSEVEKLKEELSAERRRASDSEKTVRQNSDSVRNLQEKIASLQSELQRWKDAGTASNGKTLDPVQFVRWQRRALAGRDMYRMMKQLRELSDQKLESYQRGVSLISSFLLTSHGKPLPTANSGEVLADRMLSEALTLVASLSGGTETFETPSIEDQSAPRESAENSHPET